MFSIDLTIFLFFNFFGVGNQVEPDRGSAEQHTNPFATTH